MFSFAGQYKDFKKIVSSTEPPSVIALGCSGGNISSLPRIVTGGFLADDAGNDSKVIS